MTRRIRVDTSTLEQRPDEGFFAWLARVRDEPAWLRAEAAAMREGRRQRYYLKRASEIESGRVEPWNYFEERGVRAV